VGVTRPAGAVDCGCSSARRRWSSGQLGRPSRPCCCWPLCPDLLRPNVHEFRRGTRLAVCTIAILNAGPRFVSPGISAASPRTYSAIVGLGAGPVRNRESRIFLARGLSICIYALAGIFCVCFVDEFRNSARRELSPLRPCRPYAGAWSHPR